MADPQPPQPTDPPAPPGGLAAPEVRAFLKSRASSCAVCGLQLRGCASANCPGCGWELELEALKLREPTVLNMTRQWDFLCPGCSYNLRGIKEETCPECGCPLTPQSLVHPDSPRMTATGRRPKTVAALSGLLAGWLGALGTAAVMDVRGAGDSPAPLAVGLALALLVGTLVFVSGKTAG